jgi:chemotaxis regulatin CheY-phosphate phosphatase CheZ
MPNDSSALLTARPSHDAPPALAEEDYEAIHAAVMETVRGRWFLSEYARRNRNTDTTLVLSALDRIESAMRGERATQSIDRFRFDLVEMAKAIARTKVEIAAIKPDTEHHGRIGEATDELDAIVQTTEIATSDILAAAEQVQEVAWTMREQGIDGGICDQLDGRATDIYTACEFQDLTGQRIAKVINVMRYLEGRINAMIDIWGNEPGPEVADAPAKPDPLVNGPAKPGTGLDQCDVDMMLGARSAERPAAPAYRASTGADDHGATIIEHEPASASYPASSATAPQYVVSPYVVSQLERGVPTNALADTGAEFIVAESDPDANEPPPASVQAAPPTLAAGAAPDMVADAEHAAIEAALTGEPPPATPPPADQGLADISTKIAALLALARAEQAREQAQQDAAEAPNHAMARDTAAASPTLPDTPPVAVIAPPAMTALDERAEPVSVTVTLPTADVVAAEVPSVAAEFASHPTVTADQPAFAPALPPASAADLVNTAVASVAAAPAPDFEAQWISTSDPALSLSNDPADVPDVTLALVESMRAVAAIAARASAPSDQPTAPPAAVTNDGAAVDTPFAPIPVQASARSATPPAPSDSLAPITALSEDEKIALFS